MEIGIKAGAIANNEDNYGPGVEAYRTSNPVRSHGTGNPNNITSADNGVSNEMNRENEDSKTESSANESVDNPKVGERGNLMSRSDVSDVETTKINHRALH